MSSNFYEVLGIQADASPEEVRKAYRKRALKTHPDRLPPGASAAEKQAAEEQFRNVNNAYEILVDPKNRKLYDHYGVWPPPEELPEAPSWDRGSRQSHRPSYPPFPGPDPFDDFFRNSPFGDPFARRPWSRPAPAFRDPFELFNSMFVDMLDDLYYGPSPLFSRPSDSMFGRHDRMFGGAGLRPSLFPPTPMFHPPLDFPPFPEERQGGSSWPDPRPQMYSYENSSRGYYDGRGPDGPQWVSESRMVRTVNGVTQSVWKRRDRDGNEHVTYTYPDGREKYLLNGVEQSHPTHRIQDGASVVSVHSEHSSATPVIPPETAEDPPRKRWWSRH